jgi:uncharacterized membrane protein
MTRGRIEAFSDGVIAIIITIMVLEFPEPESAEWSALGPVAPVFLTYALSFAYLGIYWNNHHHLLHAVQRINGRILWANLHLLFWLSLVPFVTGWMGHHHSAAAPAAVYGVVMLLAAVAYWVLQKTILMEHGSESVLARAIGRDLKGKISPLMYMAAIPLAFVNPWLSDALYVAVALIWLVPDRRIERALEREGR